MSNPFLGALGGSYSNSSNIHSHRQAHIDIGSSSQGTIPGRSTDSIPGNFGTNFGKIEGNLELASLSEDETFNRNWAIIMGNLKPEIERRMGEYSRGWLWE